jgi:predicted metalloprotease with PDZ domain
MRLNIRNPYWPGLAIVSIVVAVLLTVAVAQNKVAAQAGQKEKDTTAKSAGNRSKSDVAEKVRVRRGHMLGMTLEGKGEQGLTISKVEESGPAAKAGLKADDHIVSVDYHTFSRARQLEAYLASNGGRPIPFVVQRDGQQQTIAYTPPYRAGDSAWLGVFLEDGEEDAKGAKINQVYPGGPAARAGLRPGDLITQVNDEKTETPADLISTIAGLDPQTQAHFTISRNDEEQKVDVTLGAHHAFAQQGAGGNGQPQQQFQAGRGPFEDIPPHAMQLEHDRRLAEQHERIENEIRSLREEIHKLREELKDRK